MWKHEVLPSSWLFVGAVLISTLFGEASFAATADTGLCKSFFPRAVDRGPVPIVSPEIKYPQKEIFDLGEGHVVLGYTIDTQGVPHEYKIADAIGSEKYTGEAIRGLQSARYEPAKSAGRAVPFHVYSSVVQFRIEGANRVGWHERFERDYEMAHKLRTQRKYSEAISILEDTIKQPLSLYALTSASFELSRNYQELGQQEQALYHIRHAAVDAGMMIDKGLRRSALAREIELEALSQHYWRAVCDLESFTKYYRPDELEPHLRALGEKARTELLGSTSISSDVILIDPKRRDVEPYWTRRLIRPVVRIRAAEGHISSARVICRTEAIDLPVGPAIEFQVNGRKGGCDIYVFANPGTRLQVTESP